VSDLIKVARQHCNDRRLLFVLFLLCATIFAQSGALSGEHQQHHSTDHCCLLCHVGPIPFLQTSTTATVAPVFGVEWIAAIPDFEFNHDCLLTTSSSRAPPTA
jgi:hypothetical protein